ncbi:hypothetical protein O181_068016, partial [Austropuccinia psidii MF-1]|nr:hypothetical protein [Austropuccinia psidii MF-1]
LNNTWDPENKHHILRMKDTFIHHNHLCLVFELLSSNLYELIKQNSFRGLSTSLVRVFTNQLLDALTVLNEAHLIHCDLKPENILLTSLSSPEIKVIDFGSACHERQTVYTYIQSRFYRSPEVILGLPYSSAIDMWSLGCICVELFLGLPLFPGTSEYNQITRIVEMLGMPPTYMLEVGRQTLQFFDAIDDDFTSERKVYKLKTLEQYSKEHNVQEQPSKRYFQQNTLEDIISQYPVIRKGMKPADLEKEKQNRIAFIDFVKGLLNINPIERWSPQQARLHPFILGETLREPYVPMPLKSNNFGQSSNTTTANRTNELNQKSHTSNSPMDLQPSSQSISNSNQNNQNNSSGPNESTSVKRPYGGLPTAPVRSGQKVYDAAAYSQLQAQQQVINAQALAMRQHQSQAAQQSQNPYALPQDNRSNLVQPSSQSNPQQQSQHHPSTTHQHQYSSNRLSSSSQHPLGSATSATINIPHSYYTTRASGPLSGNFNPASLPNSHLPLLPASQIVYNSHLSNLSGAANSNSNLNNPSVGRQRSGTLDQMDIVPPQLQKVQVDLANYATQSLTPVLRRDDPYLSWEQRQHSSGVGINSNGSLGRRPSYRTNPQLEYLHEQAESNEGLNLSHRGQSRYNQYPSNSTYTSSAQPPTLLEHQTAHPPTSQSKLHLPSFSVIVEADLSNPTQDDNGTLGSSRFDYDIIPLDEYDHRDGGQAMAYIPMIPKRSTSNFNSTTAAGGRLPNTDEQVAQNSMMSLGRLMNS